MSSKTLLDTVKAVTGELGFNQPVVVLSSPVASDIQLRQLATAAGEELRDAYDWQSLMRQHSFIVTNASTYDLPADFHRIINQTVKVGTTYLDGSPSAMTWVRLKSGDKKFRIFGDKFELFEPGSMLGQTLTFSYISSYFVLDGGNALPKPEFTLDSDKTIYHARLFTNLVKLKFLQVKNLDSRAAAEDFNAVLQIAMSGDSPSQILSIDSPRVVDMHAPWADC